MKKRILLVVIIILILLVEDILAQNSLGRKKGSHGFHGLIYKSGFLSLLALVAIKIKIIVIITVAWTVFILGAKVWAAFRYGKLLFKGCPAHDDIYFHHSPSYEYIPPPDYDSHHHVLPPSHPIEKNIRERNHLLEPPKYIP